MITLHSEFQKMNNSQIHDNLLESIKNERTVQSHILMLIQEIYARRIYLEMGYGSMFDYLVKEMKYSESTALRRIASVKVLTLVPEAKDDLLNGKLNMNQLQKTAAMIREYKKEQKIPQTQESHNPNSTPPISPSITDMTKSALEKIKDQNCSATDEILADAFNVDLQKTRHNSKKKTTMHKDKSVTINFHLTKVQFEKLTHAKSRLSHLIPSMDNSEVLEYLCDMYLKKIDGVKNNKQNKQNDNAPENNHTENSQVDISQLSHEKYNRKSISLSVRRRVFEKYQVNDQPCCQFKNLQTGKICGSHYQLEVEHLQPIWAGGGNEFSNLTVLCANHNKFKYAQQSGLL